MTFIVDDVVRLTEGDVDGRFDGDLTVVDHYSDGGHVYYTLRDISTDMVIASIEGKQLTFVRHARELRVVTNEGKVSLRDAVDQVLKMHVDDRCSECGKGSPCPTRTMLLRGTEDTGFAAEVQRLEEIIDQIELLHRQDGVLFLVDDEPRSRCSACKELWPCETTKVIDHRNETVDGN